MSYESDNLRNKDRKSLFVQATLHFIDGRCAVKIRNMSPTGALIEAEHLPRSGTPVEIRRGELVAVGTVIWKRNGRAGVEFLSPEDVSRWMPRALGQRPADQATQVFKGALPSAIAAPPQAAATITVTDIEGVANMLDDLADTFGKDAGILFNYAAKLQTLEVASQMLRKLAAQARERRAAP